MIYGGIDLSTVDPNPTVDDTVYGGDGGAADLSNVANTVGQWGAVIGSIVSNTPITSAQTRTGNYVPIGAYGSQIRQPGPNWMVIGIVVLGIAAGAWFFSGRK